MHKTQIEAIFMENGLSSLYQTYEFPLYLHGLLDDNEFTEQLELFLSSYDFQDEPLPFDAFLYHYRIFNHMLKQRKWSEYIQYKIQ